MGFPSICPYSILMPKPIDDLLDLWSYLKFLVRLALFYLGLFDPTDTTNAAYSSLPAPPRRLTQLQVISSSLVLPSTTPESIKEKLPIITFAEFSTNEAVISGGSDENDENEDAEGAVCTVCLCCLEDHHEVRKLGSCNHVYHMGCLDRWVDLGQVTCPLCRSLLVPNGENDGIDGKDSLVLDRFSYLFSDDLWSLDRL